MDGRLGNLVSLEDVKRLRETMYGPLPPKPTTKASATSASLKLPRSRGMGNPSESFDPIRNPGGGWGSGSFLSIVHIGVDPNLPPHRQEEAKKHLTRCLNLGITAFRPNLSTIDVVELVVRELETDPLFNSGRGSALTANGTVEMEASIMDGKGRRCGAVSGLTIDELGDPVEFGFSHVGDRVEHRGEGSSGGGGSGVENAGGQSSGGGNGNEGIGGGRQGGGIEGREGGVRAGGRGGGNRDDDDGNNGGGRRIGEIENGRIPRILREGNMVVIFFPLTLQVVAVCFDLDDSNLSAFDSVLRCFALVCCLWSSVLFMNSVLERDERAARNLSIIGAILTALGLISIIAVKVPPNLRFINGLAFLYVLAIFLKAYPGN